MPTSSKVASAGTSQINRDAIGLYNMADRPDFADTERGFIAPCPEKVQLDGDQAAPSAYAAVLDDFDLNFPSSRRSAMRGTH
jgi:alkyl sulfatase BDS1-like metallo-beta-lactamase superfamily hydrolase